MKPHVLLKVICFISFIFLSGCLSENYVNPYAIDHGNKDLLIIEELSGQQAHLNINKMVIYLYYEKSKDKIEVNRNQATLNFDNNSPKILRIVTKEKFVDLKNFRATNNLLREVPQFALNEGIKRIDVSHNKIEKLPVFHKNSSLLLLDLSYNKLKYDQLLKMQLPKGSTVNITKTGISCKYVFEYAKRNPEITVISECYSTKVTSADIVK